MALVGPNTFCPITWLVKRQGAVTHSSSEAEIVSLDTSLRTLGLPCVIFWDIVVGMFSRDSSDTIAANYNESTFMTVSDIIDYVPPLLPPLKHRTFCKILEDNDAVIHMCIKARAPKLRHLARTLRIDLDWLFERFLTDPALSITYINTKLQLADLFTKASFTSMQWNALLQLIQTCKSQQKQPPQTAASIALEMENSECFEDCIEFDGQSETIW